MKDKIESFNVCITEVELQDFESSIGVSRLPEDYRVFLLECNGGYTTDEDAFKFYSSSNGSLLNVLFGVNIKDGSFDSNDLTRGLQVYTDRVPSTFLPIGEDAGGNQLCLGINDDNFGEVWFWDQEEETHEWEETTMDNMTLVAKTFTDFINGLYKFELEDNSDE